MIFKYKISTYSANINMQTGAVSRNLQSVIKQIFSLINNLCNFQIGRIQNENQLCYLGKNLFKSNAYNAFPDSTVDTSPYGRGAPFKVGPISPFNYRAAKNLPREDLFLLVENLLGEKTTPPINSLLDEKIVLSPNNLLEEKTIPSTKYFLDEKNDTPLNFLLAEKVTPPQKTFLGDKATLTQTNHLVEETDHPQPNLLGEKSAHPQITFLADKTIPKQINLLAEKVSHQTNHLAEKTISSTNILIADKITNSSPISLCLDLGTQTGWALLGRKKIITSGCENFKGDRFQSGGVRFLKFINFLDKLFSSADNQLKIIFFEAVRRHLGVDAAHAYGGFLGNLTAWCEQHDISYEGVPVGTIKRHATGKGNATKAMVIENMKQRGHKPVDDNEADALALAYWALDNRLRSL